MVSDITNHQTNRPLNTEIKRIDTMRSAALNSTFHLRRLVRSGRPSIGVISQPHRYFGGSSDKPPSSSVNFPIFVSSKICPHPRFDVCNRPSSATSTRFLSSVAIDDPESGDTKIIPFLLADIGEGIAEVELLQWFVEPGDRIAQFDRVCEVQSDKATVEITSRFDGVVDSLNGQVGDMISVGSPLMHIAVEDDGSAPPTSSSAGDETPSPPAPVSPTLHNVDDKKDRLHIPQVASSFPDYGHDEEGNSGEARISARVLATPAVRKLSMDHDIDLRAMVGTGPKGRILKSDILKIIKAKEGPHVVTQSSGPAQTSNKSSQSSASSKSSSSSQSRVEITPGEDTIVPIRGYNRLMVKSMTESLQVPHMCYSDEVNMNAIKACREDLKPIAAEQGVRLSYLPFLIKAASLAILQYPVLNSSINVEDSTLTYHGDHNIGVAMDTPRGLAVPVVKHCQALSVLEIAKELSRLQEAAQEGNLAEEDITGATFTLSNIGTIGGTYMSPIVAPPQVAIGAVGKIQRLPRFVGDTDEVMTANIMQISWGGDHRVIDGATMARFSNQWKDYIEKPMSMTFSMK